MAAVGVSTGGAASDATPMDDKAKWVDLNKVVGRYGPLAGPDFQVEGALQRLHDFPVLVVGAGGLGCELLKDLALSGFCNIHVIDMDTIEYSNLNRQFLFRATDVKRPKATVAAEFINRRITGANVVPHVCMLQSKPASFYKQFKLVISGLDSIPARRWLNAMLCSLVERDSEGNVDPFTIIPLIDGGTEGFKGHARVILPYITACFECAIDAFPPQTKYPICTIASEPRLPEHCIEWASQIAWKSPDFPKPFPPGTKLDADDPQHISWVYEQALARATEKGISGVTLRLTLGVCKNIVPAIASTNAIISAACANEALKFATSCSQSLENYMMYNGGVGVYTYTFEYTKKENCLACGSKTALYTIPRTTKLAELIEQLRTDPRLQMQSPSLIIPGGGMLFMQSPEPLREATLPNLEKTLEQLLGATGNDDVSVSDPSLPSLNLRLSVQFSD
ncbi:ubiquitin-activating enzyme E1C [Pelomyxa schiedti]|nr:ubiquitin-activating enzyme E1C [Pelomyxa schiedti]